MHWFLKFIFGLKLHMFRTVPLSIIRSFSLNTHVEFQSKNKFEKLVRLVGFIVRNLSWCVVTWTSKTCHTLFRLMNIKIIVSEVKSTFFVKKELEKLF